jgi:hypothetical protein
MLIDAAQHPPPNAQKTSTPGSAVANTTSSAGIEDSTQENDEAEIPLFVHGRLWPQLPWLPRPEQLTRPSQYVSDLLVGLYFDRIHHTFPALFKPHFMTRYRRMLASSESSGPTEASTGEWGTSSSDMNSEDPEFLLIFFAVCACGRSMLPEGPDSGLPGLEYFEKALLLYYASNGQTSVERVQCLALLAMCSAGWNTLTKSWSLAGQAVRDAVDIGLHLSSRRVRHMGSGSQHGAGDAAAAYHTSSELLRRQMSRRLWWCVYSLDRVVSICLGRPFAVDDRDCACDLPYDLGDEELQRQCLSQAQTLAAVDPGSVDSMKAPSTSSSPITGFIAFARLCRIAGKIQRLGSPSALIRLSATHESNTAAKKAHLLARRVATLDRALHEWLDDLPDSICYSANEAEGAGPGSNPSLVMCVIIFMMHSGSLLTLYWCLLRSFRTGNDHSDGLAPDAAKNAVLQCISAAQSSIKAAELVRSLVPPSHSLAICVHCLTLSGVAL